MIADISKYQGHPDFKQLKDAVDTLIIRVQYGSKLEDRDHKYDEAHCVNYNISFGEYAFGHYVSEKDAIVEARDFLQRKDNHAKFLVLDVEDDTVQSCGTKNIKVASQTFIDTCRDAGMRTGYYVSHQLYKLYGLDEVKADFLWLPRYGVNNGKPSIKPDWPCDLWQYTSKGKLPGIKGYVDLSMLMRGHDLNWLLGIKPKKEEAVVSNGPFKDVSADRWSADAIKRLKDKGIIHGRPDGTFGPNDAATREEMAVVVDNLLTYLDKQDEEKSAQ